MQFRRRGLQGAGFDGFVTAEVLLDPKARRAIPQCNGVYIVLYEGGEPPRLSRVSPAGWFNGRDPSIPRSQLTARWVTGADLVYVGKAAKSARTDLRYRIRSLVRYGAGHAIGHEGGRAMWHLSGSHRLLVAWRCVATAHEAEHEERRLIDAFEEVHGAVPFANAY